MKSIIKHFFIVLILVCSTATLSAKETAKYIFYFIGDGMTAAQISLAQAALKDKSFQENYAKQTSASSLKSSLNLESLAITGIATTNADNRYITDSAAAATALATGCKTDVGIISQDNKGGTLKTMAEMAKDKGMKVGIVSSVSIDHATPACFYAHSSSRSRYTEISDQLLDSGFDYFAGGSPKWDKRAQSEKTDIKTAYLSYVETAKKKGFDFITNKKDFDALNSSSKKPVIATLNMLSEQQNISDGSAMPYTIELLKYKEDDRITLAQFTQKGIEILENPKGFFMMVEGGKIDWTCHANDAASCAYETVAFDDAIGVALEFATKHPKETLIVVTGDHDCGGLSIGFAGTKYSLSFDLLAKSKTSHISFSQESIKRISEGQTFYQLLDYACEEFGFIYGKVRSKRALSTTMDLSDYELSKLKTGYENSLKKIKKQAFDDHVKYTATYGGYDPFTTTCTNILNNKAGVDFSSYTHTAVPAMVFAHGVNAHLFSGYYDNTDIAKRIIQGSALEKK